MTNKELHRKLWQWLADNPYKEKNDWPEWIHNGGKHFSDTQCFACEESNNDCEFCPILWDNPESNPRMCLNSHSEYKKWRRGNIKERSRLALVIKELWK